MKALCVWLLLCLIWSSTWLCIKLGLRDLPPLSFAAIRFLIAAFVLLAIAIAQRTGLPRKRRDWMLISVTGVLSFAVNYGLLFWGEQYISSGLAAVLQATIPAFGLLIAHYYLPHEQLTLLKIGAVGLGIAGVTIIFSDQLHVAGRLALWGSIAVVCGALAVAYANVLVKKYAGHLRPSALAAGQMFCGILPLFSLGIVREGNPWKFHWTTLAVSALLYLALVGSVAAFLLYYWLLKHMDVTKTMLISLATPLLAVTIGWLVLGETLMWRTFVGGACILLGIALILTRRDARHAPHDIIEGTQPGAEAIS